MAQIKIEPPESRTEAVIANNSMGKALTRSHGYRTLVMALLLLASIAGCQKPAARFEIVNYVDVGDSEQLYEVFDEAYYRDTPDGNVDVVARRTSHGDTDEAGRITQIVHIRSVFSPIDDRNKIESSMINGVVDYAIVGDLGAVCFQGAGFASFSENRNGDKLIGELEQSGLRQVRRVGEMGDIFNRTRLTGEFRATRDSKAVVGILNELNRFLGPQPRYVPPPPGTNPL